MKSDDKKKATTMAKYANVTVDVTNPAVRCPVVLLLDTSKSMAGQPITELEEALCQFISEVKDDVAAAASVGLCIITLQDDTLFFIYQSREICGRSKAAGKCCFLIWMCEKDV